MGVYYVYTKKDKEIKNMTKKQIIANEYVNETMSKDSELVLTVRRLTNSETLESIEENLENLNKLVAYYNQALTNAKNK